MAEQQPQYEVGHAAWGGRPPFGQRRPVVRAADQPVATRSIDVRDALAVVLLILGVAGAFGFAAAEWGWLVVGFGASCAAVAGGVALGWRER